VCYYVVGIFLQDRCSLNKPVYFIRDKNIYTHTCICWHHISVRMLQWSHCFVMETWTGTSYDTRNSSTVSHSLYPTTDIACTWLPLFLRSTASLYMTFTWNTQNYTLDRWTLLQHSWRPWTNVTLVFAGVYTWNLEKKHANY